MPDEEFGTFIGLHTRIDQAVRHTRALVNSTITEPHEDIFLSLNNLARRLSRLEHDPNERPPSFSITEDENG